MHTRVLSLRCSAEHHSMQRPAIHRHTAPVHHRIMASVRNLSWSDTAPLSAAVQSFTQPSEANEPTPALTCKSWCGKAANTDLACGMCIIPQVMLAALYVLCVCCVHRIVQRSKHPSRVAHACVTSCVYIYIIAIVWSPHVPVLTKTHFEM